MSQTSIELITSDTQYHAPYTHRIILLCEEKNIPYHLTFIDLQNKPQWFLDIAPIGEVPVMRTSDSIIAGSLNIAHYVDKLSTPHFIPTEAILYSDFTKKLASIDAFGHALLTFLRARKNTIPDLIPLNQYMATFDAMLKRPYLSGDSISYLDFALVPHILQIHALELLVFPFSMLVKHQNLLTWFEKMMTRHSVQSTSQEFPQQFVEHLKHRGFFMQFCDGYFRHPHI